MKIFEVTIEDLKAYSHVYISDDDDLFTIILASAKAYISAHTGLPLSIPPDTEPTKTVDDCEDLTIALFVLCNDLYDNRIYNVNDQDVNPLISAMLGMHSVNLL